MVKEKYRPIDSTWKASIDQGTRPNINRRFDCIYGDLDLERLFKKITEEIAFDFKSYEGDEWVDLTFELERPYSDYEDLFNYFKSRNTFTYLKFLVTNWKCVEITETFELKNGLCFLKIDMRKITISFYFNGLNYK